MLSALQVLWSYGRCWRFQFVGTRFISDGHAMILGDLCLSLDLLRASPDWSRWAAAYFSLAGYALTP
jgi:hypothetical protein